MPWYLVPIIIIIIIIIIIRLGGEWSAHYIRPLSLNEYFTAQFDNDLQLASLWNHSAAMHKI